MTTGPACCSTTRAGVTGKYEDLRGAYETIASVVGAFDELPPKPLVMFVGAHSAGLSLAHSLLDELPGFLSGIYLQVGPALRAADIDAADAGLASSETFTPSNARRQKPEPDPDDRQNGGPSSRAHLEALGRSFSAKRVAELGERSSVTPWLQPR